MKDKDFLMWIHDRLVHVYKENENVDFLHKLRNIIDNMDAEKETINTMSSSVYLSEITAPAGTTFIFDDNGVIRTAKVSEWSPRGYVYVQSLGWKLPSELKVLDILPEKRTKTKVVDIPSVKKKNKQETK